MCLSLLGNPACSAKGIRATVCIVDAKSLGFQCNFNGEKKGYFVPFEQGGDLMCSSPEETEDFLKACKQDHKILDIVMCSWVSGSFLCMSKVAQAYTMSPEKVDNYFCLGHQDFKRLGERCLKP